MIELVPLGDQAWMARFESEEEAAAWGEEVRRARPEGVVDVVTAYQAVAVHADPGLVDLEDLGEWLKRVDATRSLERESVLHRIPVLYEGADLEEVAARLGTSVGRVIAEHGGTEYRVFAVGFLPGFPYAGYLPEGLRGVPRLAEPRREVPAGSVAIAGRQTGIYPGVSPGGWRLLGRTPLVIAEPEDGFFPIRPGDRLRFEAIGAEEFEERRGRRLGSAESERERGGTAMPL